MVILNVGLTSGNLLGCSRQPIYPEFVQAVLVVLLGDLKEYLPQNRLKISHLKNYEISGEDSAQKMSSSPTVLTP